MRTVPAAFLMLLAGCGSGGGDVLVGATQATDYDRIYDASQVKRIEIEMRSEDREAMDRQLDREIYLPWRERDTTYVDATVRFEARPGIRFRHHCPTRSW